MKTTINLTQDEIKNIISSYFKNNHNIEVEDINFSSYQEDVNDSMRYSISVYTKELVLK